MSSDEVCMVFLEEYQVLKAADKSDDDMIQAVLRTESPLVAALGQVVGLSSLSASITSHTLANDVSSYAAYANVTPEESKPSLWGVGLGVSLQQAKLRAVVSALQIGGYIKTTLSSHYFTGPPQTP
ncbi:hypothetical protein AA0116_g13499 [Alternaria tenuissima]|nr:hypothetical protein AA0116_g13499 [Alternaria tenuissima]